MQIPENQRSRAVPTGCYPPSMDLDDPRIFSLFLEIYGTLPRAGPGSTEDTLRALALVPGDSRPRTVLDLGCGPGAQTVVLAEALPEASIIAMDLTPQMVSEAGRRCAEAGFGERVRVRRGDMLGPDRAAREPGSHLVRGRHLLRRRRAGAQNLATSPLAERRRRFHRADLDPPLASRGSRGVVADEYPAITDESGVRAAVSAAGFDTIGCFPLPAAAWWNEYYGPMEQRVAEFRAQHEDDPLATEIADEAEKEIETFRRYPEYYTYGFFVVRPTASPRNR